MKIFPKMAFFSLLFHPFLLHAEEDTLLSKACLEEDCSDYCTAKCAEIVISTENALCVEACKNSSAMKNESSIDEKEDDITAKEISISQKEGLFNDSELNFTNGKTSS